MDEKDKFDPLVVMIIPPAILVVIAYMGYQFRIRKSNICSKID